MAKIEKITQLAQIAYEAYGAQTKYKNWQGLPMPQWVELPPTIQAAWCAAVKKICWSIEVAYVDDTDPRPEE